MSESSSSCSDGGGIDNPKKFNYKFIETGKSKEDGFQITHDSNFKHKKKQVGWQEREHILQLELQERRALE